MESSREKKTNCYLATDHQTFIFFFSLSLSFFSLGVRARIFLSGQKEKWGNNVFSATDTAALFKQQRRGAIHATPMPQAAFIAR